MKHSEEIKMTKYIFKNIVKKKKWNILKYLHRKYGKRKNMYSISMYFITVMSRLIILQRLYVILIIDYIVCTDMNFTTVKKIKYYKKKMF